VVDRRTVVFDDKPSKPEKAKQAPPPEEKELSPEDDAYWAGGPKEGQAAEKSDPLPPPAHMRDKPGCGCRVGEPASGTAGLGLSALALVLLARRVRRLA
jgi:MYXO-CTERM domain-containing protein